MELVLSLIFLVFGAFSTESQDNYNEDYKDVRARIYERLHDRNPLRENAPTRKLSTTDPREDSSNLLTQTNEGIDEPATPKCYGLDKAIELEEAAQDKNQYEQLHNRGHLRENADKNQNNFVQAVWAGRLDVVKSLAKKVDLNRADKYGCTPVHVAAYKGHKEIVKFLLEKVDLNRADEHGCTPICIAAMEGHTEIVKFLAITVDLNGADEIGCTPVHFAARQGHTEIVKFLADKVDLNRANKFGCTPVYWAAMKGHTEIVEFLADRVDLNRANNNGHTPIDIAAMEGHMEIVKFLIEKKVNLGEHLLEFAPTEEIKQSIEEELKYQSDFSEAVRKGCLDDVKFLAETVDLNRADKFGRTPVWIAAWESRTEIVEFLADRVDLNQADSHGHTPVHVAAYKGHKEIVNFLIEKNVKLEEILLEIAATEEIKQIIANALKE